MDSLIWDDSFSVNNAMIDSQHKQIIDLINQMEEAVNKGATRDETAAILMRLTSYTVKHFNYEENLLSEAGYANLDQHRVKHGKFIKKVDDFFSQINEGEETLPLEVFIAMYEWWRNHILKEDLDFANLLEAKGITTNL